MDQESLLEYSAYQGLNYIYARIRFLDHLTFGTETDQQLQPSTNSGRHPSGLFQNRSMKGAMNLAIHCAKNRTTERVPN